MAEKNVQLITNSLPVTGNITTLPLWLVIELLESTLPQSLVIELLWVKQIGLDIVTATCFDKLVWEEFIINWFNKIIPLFNILQLLVNYCFCFYITPCKPSYVDVINMVAKQQCIGRVSVLDTHWQLLWCMTQWYCWRNNGPLLLSVRILIL